MPNALLGHLQGSEMSTEYQVIEDAFLLCEYVFQRVENFPRLHRFTLGGTLTTQCTMILNELIRVKYTPNGAEKVACLQKINVEIEVFRFQLRLAYNLRALPPNAHHHAMERLHNIGSQIGGWIKAIRSKLPT